MLTANALFAFNRQDSLRGGNGNGRNWWDVQYYRLYVSLNDQERSIAGSTTIVFKISGRVSDSMQIDLQEPLQLDSAVALGESIPFTREGNVFWLKHPFRKQLQGSQQTLKLYYHGIPKAARKAPWDGGLVWSKDANGNPWVAVACQGTGASCWWPCKDIQSDEPDQGMKIRLSGPSDLEAIANGRFGSRLRTGNRQQIDWETADPINNYDVTFYLGDYVHWNEDYQGEKGPLHLIFCSLRDNEAIARKQFKEVTRMLSAFEYWFGPYPFYDDGYKIVEAPYLGMEHQSAIAYGNGYQNGYQGKDRSNTGIGLLFDFIVVHESGHEWFGNSITAADIADNWIHEGFTTYAEALFVEYWFGPDKARAYTMGQWANIQNDVPVQGHYGVNDDGSSDKYDKAAAMIHTIRELMHDDTKFRQMLRTMNQRFYHKQITGAQMESFLKEFTGLPLQPVFDQYLRSTDIPVLEWKRKRKTLSVRFSHCADGFALPVRIHEGNAAAQSVTIGSNWQELKLKDAESSISFEHYFLIKENQVH
ncbi:M1 family metallopeptidase [Rurimicrobium arvi]|uniref:M1 family metallopeptidase n=1 Tax=Rurimicrobium arvi TaxID=2049916 RepID=A0ABP8MPH6_9BACT